MNNYSWIQKKLHKFALSSQIIRETSFDIEKSLVSTKNINEDHVFVAGLARSGTTIMLNGLYKSNLFASLSYSDMPFVLAPNIWSNFSSSYKNTKLIERAHGDGIKISTSSPEAFEEVFWMTFNDKDKESAKNFKDFIALINNKYNKKRYLSKNNQNIRRLDLISKILPHSKILIPFRNPFQHSNSLLTQHKRFINLAKKDNFITDYMKWIGHSEFGPNYIPIIDENLKHQNEMNINHWLEQWYKTYLNSYKKYINSENIYFVSYEKLCQSEEYWENILNLLNIKIKYSFSFKDSEKEFSARFDSELAKKATDLESKLNSLTI